MLNLGQLVMTGISGVSLTKAEEGFLKKENIGGVVLFKNNFENPAQLAELCNSIQKCRLEEPLFIAVDQEGGRVQRFKDPFINIPSMFDLARLNSPKECYQLLYYVGLELKAVGINLNFAPVCDVWFNKKNNVIGDRSFNSDIETVSKFVSSAIRGFSKADILTCAKHFPGHGRTLKDSHYYLPFLKTSKNVIVKEELPTFIKAVKSKVDFVMMAHLQIDALDENNPTSLSKKSYEFLRKELRFNKIIISDDMQMGAITKKYSVKNAAFMAIDSGADIIEYRDFELAREGYEALQENLKLGKLTLAQIKEKSDRIAQTKSKYFINYKDIYIPEISKVFNIPDKLSFIKELNQKIASLKAEVNIEK